MRYDVALAACKSYEDAEVSAALETAVTAAGGLDWVTPGMRVALKLNLVSAMKPEEAATVHPAVVCALVRMLQARGAHVVLGDSPGGLYNAAHLQRVYDVTGLRAAEALAAGDEDEAVGQLRTQRTFLHDHLLNWLPLLTNDMRLFSRTLFYQGLAQLAMGFAEEDASILAELLDSVEVAA